MGSEGIDRVALPDIGLGTMRLRGDDCRIITEAALATGYRHIDTARKYGNEEDVGAAISSSAVPRGDVIVTTKLAPDELTSSLVRNATEESLRRLRTDYVDLLLIHWPNPEVPLEQTLQAMSDLRDRGLVRALGVANFPTALLAEATRLEPGLITDQVEHHPYLAQDAVLDRVRAEGMVLTAYCPLARQRLLDDPVLVEIAADHGCTSAQIALRWLVQQDDVVAIPGTSNVSRLTENLEVLSGPRLSDDEMSRIRGLARGERLVDPPHAPGWDAD
jgi:2,5-diketo-D-gluconate reductase B